MDPTTILQTVHSWSVHDQLDFLFQAWDQLTEGGWQPEPTEELKAELERRLAAHRADPTWAVTGEQVVGRVRRPR